MCSVYGLLVSPHSEPMMMSERVRREYVVVSILVKLHKMLSVLLTYSLFHLIC